MKGKSSAHHARPDDRNVDQLLLEEELEHRDAPVQQMLQHEDVDPGLVVAVDHVPAAIRRGRSRPATSHRVRCVRRIHALLPATHAVAIRFSTRSIAARTGLAGTTSLTSANSEEQRAPEQRVQRQQRRRDDAAQERRQVQPFSSKCLRRCSSDTNSSSEGSSALRGRHHADDLAVLYDRQMPEAALVHHQQCRSEGLLRGDRVRFRCHHVGQARRVCIESLRARRGIRCRVRCRCPPDGLRR